MMLLLILLRLHVMLLLLVTSCMDTMPSWAHTATAPAMQGWDIEMQVPNIGFWS